jgi:HK97 family phage major capsid protein
MVDMSKKHFKGTRGLPDVRVENPSRNNLGKRISQLVEAIRRNETDLEKLADATLELARDQTRLMGERRTGYETADAENRPGGFFDLNYPGSGKGINPLNRFRGWTFEKAMTAVLTERAGTVRVPGVNESTIREIQSKADDLYVVGTLLGCYDRRGRGVNEARLKSLYTYHEFQHLTRELRKALSTIAGRGGDWIPTGFSVQFIDRVHLLLKVGAIHPRFVMTTNPFKLPVVATDSYAYLAAESTEDASTKLKASTPATTNVTFTAKKLAARTLLSEEVTEDSIVSALEFIKGKIAYAIAASIEHTIVNGDVDGALDATDIEGKPIDSNSAVKAWNGYRKILSQNADSVSIDAGGDFNGGTAENNLRTLREYMGKYGVDPGKVALVVGPMGFNRLLGMPSYKNVQVFGPMASNVQGVITKFDGMDVILSEYVREDLGDSGLSGGGSSGYVDSVALMVNKDAFYIGDRRMLTIKSASDIETDQELVVATERMDFRPVYGTGENVVTRVYDLR